jgi:hypothetical protein
MLSTTFDAVMRDEKEFCPKCARDDLHCTHGRGRREALFTGVSSCQTSSDTVIAWTV